MRSILIFLAVSGLAASGLAAASCGDTVSSRLDEIERYVDDYPSQALSSLDSIPQKELNTRRARAKYALLKSAALERNNVKVLSDSIITPALNYYDAFGSDDDKLNAYYYRGLISYHTGDYDEAMAWFAKARRYAGDAADKATAASLYDKLGLIYGFIFDKDRSRESFDLASQACLDAADTSGYIDEIGNAMSLCVAAEDYEAARRYDDAIREVIDKADDRQMCEYLANRIFIALNDGTITREQIEEYEKAFPDSLVWWGAVAWGYAGLGKPEKALDIMTRIPVKDIDSTDLPAYWYLMSDLYAGVGDYRSAFECDRRYSAAEYEHTTQAFRSDIKDIGSGMQAAMLTQKHRYRMLITVLCSIISGILSIVSITLLLRKLRRRTDERRRAEEEAASAREMLEKAQMELDCLNALREDRSKSLTAETIRAIDERLEVLNDCVRSVMSGYGSDAVRHLNSLMSDREHFLSSTREMFLLSHIDFIRRLQAAGLNRTEISVCCLIALGFSGKELSGYMGLQNSTYRNKVYAMRKKLGLKDDNRELATILKEMLRS